MVSNSLSILRVKLSRLFLLFCFNIVFVWSCNQQLQLNKLNREELLELVNESNQLNLTQAIFQTENLKPIDEAAIQKLKEGVLACDYYADSDKVIRKAVVRPATYYDHITAILIKRKGYDPQDGINLIEIECDSLPYKMDAFYRLKLSDMKEPISGSDTLGVYDFERSKIASLVEKCGFPSAENLGKDALRTFWLMVQHSEADVMTYYFPYFEQAVKDGDLKEGVFVLMIDRLLMRHNYPQIYGSQILNSQLYPIANPESVDSLRASVGLEPLEEYLKHFDLR